MGNLSFSFLILVASALVSFDATATITFVNPTIASTGASNLSLPATATTAIPGASPGASPIPSGPTTATFYFSNISGDFGASNPSGLPIYSADGTTACSIALNANCRNLTDPFTLTATTTAALSGAPQIYLLYCPTLPTASTAVAASGCAVLAQAPIATGQAVTLSTTWGTVCSKIASSTSPIADMNSSCVSASGIANNVPLYLMVDINGSSTFSSESLSFALWVDSVIPKNSSSVTTALLGLYDFLAFPGDTQILIQKPLTDASFPTGDNSVGIQAARFLYYKDTSGSNTFSANTFSNIPTIINALNFPHTDLQVNAVTGALNSGAISNLDNGVRYYLQAALVDMAGNVGYQTPPVGTNPTDNTISHSAVPDQIVGLLSQSGRCFIATAAFGSPMAKEVQTLRDFRDRFLMPHSLGRNFVGWYYRHSPEWAAGIANDDDLRAIVRIFLYPVVGFSWMALHWGASNAFLFTTTLLLFPFLILTWRRSRLQMKVGE